MRVLSNTIIKRLGALNYEYPQNKILAGFDANNIYANDLKIHNTSKLERPYKETFFSTHDTSNTIPYKNYLATEFPCNYSPRSNVEAEDNTRNYTAGKIDKTPIWKNTAYMNVLDKNLRAKCGTLYSFQDSASVKHFVQIDYNEPILSASHNYTINISLVQGNDLSSIQASTIKSYSNGIITPFNPNYVYTGVPSIFWIDTTRKFIYLNMYAGYTYSADINSYQYQARLLYRVSYTTVADGGSLSLGNYEYIATPGTSLYTMSYMHADQLFLCGFGNNGNPVYLRAVEKNAAGSINSWYNAAPYTDTHYHRYIIFEHVLSNNTILTLHDFDSTTGWGLGANINDTSNRITGHCSPTCFEQVDSDNYNAFFPGFNTNNQLTPILIKWNKATNVFQPIRVPTSIQATIKNQYQDVHDDAVPYTYTFSNTTLSLSLKVVAPVVMEIVTGELGNKYLVVYNDLFNNRMRAYCTSTGVRNIVTFSITNSWYTLTHLQTASIDSLFSLPLNSNRTKLAVAEAANVSLWSFNEINYWQKTITTPAIAYYLVRKDDNSFYAVTMESDTLGDLAITQYPERRYSTSRILEINENASSKQIVINLGSDVSYTGTSQNKAISVDVLDNGLRSVESVTLTISSDNAVFDTTPQANTTTIVTSSTASTSVPLILNSPGVVFISAKFTDLEV